jgi:hypothetical protein
MNIMNAYGYTELVRDYIWAENKYDVIKCEKPKNKFPYNYSGFLNWDNNQIPTSSVYTDRLYQQDSKKYNKLCQKHWGDIGQYWNNRKPNKIQDFLRDWFDNQNINLCFVKEYCNQSSGYPVWCLAWNLNQ